MQAGMESCPVKTVISGTMGFGLGGVFGLFMASVCFLLEILASERRLHIFLLDVLRFDPDPPRSSYREPPLA